MNRVLETFETLRKRAGMGTKQTQTTAYVSLLCHFGLVVHFSSTSRRRHPLKLTEKVHSSVSAANFFDVTVACARTFVPDKIVFLASLSRSSPRRQPLDNLDQWLQPIGATLGEGIEFVLAGVEQSNRFGAVSTGRDRRLVAGGRLQPTAMIGRLVESVWFATFRDTNVQSFQMDS